jgi:hypothetical protein
VTRQTITERLAGGGSRRRQVVAAAGTIVVVATVIGIVVGAGAPAASKGQGAANTSTGATTVQRRDLVQTDTESGTLGYANAQTVFNRLTGTITYLPAVGQVVSPGGTLYQVNGYPVVLFNGNYPAYRTLKSGDSDGPDIEELNSDLKAMGFDPYDEITIDDVWQTGTTAAVDRFQASIGRTETGKLTLGRIVFLPGSQLINAVDTTIGSTGGSAGTGSPSSGASYSPPAPKPERVSYDSPAQPHTEFVDFSTSAATPPTATPTGTTPTGTTPTGTTPTGTTPTGTTPTGTTPTGTTPPMSGTPGTPSSGLQTIIQLLETQNRLLQAELKASAKGSGGKSPSTSGTGSKSPSSTSSPPKSGATSPSATSPSASSSASHGNSNAGNASATAILSTTSTNLVVTVQLDATKQSEAKLHEPVTVQLPDGSTVNGKITGVSPVATTTNTGSNSGSPSNSAPAATIPVTVSLDRHANTRGLDQAAVSVNFEAQVANHVLSVAVTALLATQGGGYAIQLAAPPHRLVAVTPGLFAAGYVQISGSGIQDGMQVTDSQG